MRNSRRPPWWVFPSVFELKTWQPRGSALAYNSRQRRSDRRFFRTYLHVGTSYRQWHSPSSGSLTSISRKGAAKNEIKVGRGLSFLFSLLKIDPGLTSLRFPLPVCHRAPVCVCETEQTRTRSAGRGRSTPLLLLLWCLKGGKLVELLNGGSVSVDIAIYCS